jgi:phage shock protein C
MDKKIYKIEAEKKISGVCAGVSEYLNIDVTIVRVLWLLAALCWGCGLILYIICAFVFPDKTEVVKDNVKEAKVKESKTKKSDK